MRGQRSQRTGPKRRFPNGTFQTQDPERKTSFDCRHDQAGNCKCKTASKTCSGTCWDWKRYWESHAQAEEIEAIVTAILGFSSNKVSDNKLTSNLVDDKTIFEGYSEDYLRIQTESKDNLYNKITSVILQESNNDYIIAKIL